LPPACAAGRPAARPPRLWPDLPAEGRLQIAQAIAALMRRMQAMPRAGGRETGRADISTNTEERLTTAHRAKLAFIYVRQSSVNQVRQHQESTELQYRLVDRAIGLGWP
jgi:hypothetical protein